MFSRIIGLGIIYSEFYFDLSDGIVWTLIDFIFQSALIFIIYLITVYVIESIVLYNFEYNDEISKRKNISYAVICFSNSVGLAYLFKTILAVSQGSYEVLPILWLFSTAILGFSLKTFKYLTRLNLNFLILQKNLSVSFVYMGFFFGLVLLLSNSIAHEIVDIKWYSIQVMLKIILSLIILPFFRFGVVWAFNLNDDYAIKTKNKADELIEPEIGYGIFQGSLIFTSCFLTTVITGQVNFGSFYPNF
ncbi:hypothetical protein N9O57_02145 [bacterium]|nr:hypothetical protein [bacterium]